MKQLVTIILLTVSLNCIGQDFQFDKTKISSKTKQVVAKIEQDNWLMSSAVGAAGSRPKQFDNFTDLRKIATTLELQELTNHPNGVVRCYSFWALTYDSSVSLLPIIIKHIPDDEKISTMFGCIVEREKVGDFFISLVTPENIDMDSKKLSSSEFAYLDSILLYTPNNLYARDNAINRIQLSNATYNRIRELVLEEKDQTALVKLAKFKKKQDISIILNNKLEGERYDQLFYTYQAISEFPDNAFLPLLKKSLFKAIDETYWSTEWRELYKAIASYQNDTALQLLKVPFNKTKYENIRHYHIDFIFQAVQQFYTSIYNDLLWELWENEKMINAKVFNLLYLTNPDRAFNLTKKTMQHPNEFYYQNTGGTDELDEKPLNLLEMMLDSVYVRDKPGAIDLINKNIRESNVHQFPTFADKALELRDTSFIASFFYRLKLEDNPHIYLKATEVLIALKDNAINKRILEIATKNPALRKDWGGKAFAKLLSDSGIR